MCLADHFRFFARSYQPRWCRAEARGCTVRRSQPHQFCQVPCSVDDRVMNGTDSIELWYSEQTLCHWHFVHHKSHIGWAGIQPGRSRWQADVHAWATARRALWNCPISSELRGGSVGLNRNWQVPLTLYFNP